jgi:outer membrane protein TolC
VVAPTRTDHAARRGAFKREDVLRSAEARRPDVHSSHARTEALRESAQEPLYRLAPTLGASVQVRTTIDARPPDVANDETALLTLSWTIYDGGARYGDRKSRLAQLDSQALDEQMLRRSIATDVAIAISALHAARETYKISEEAVAAATKGTEETDFLYKQGLARAIELTDANASRYDAEVNLESAALAMEQAYLQLRQALGLDPTGDDLAGEKPATKGAE